MKSISPIFQSASNHHRQQGAVMVISLVMLTALTVLGVTALRTTGLHEKMAANLQEQGAAFQVAESGIVEMINKPGEFNTANNHSVSGEITKKVQTVQNSAGEDMAEVVYDRCFSVEMPAPRSKTAKQAKHFHFDTYSGGKTARTGGRVVLHQGVYMEKNFAKEKTLIETGNESNKTNPCLAIAEVKFSDE